MKKSDVFLLGLMVLATGLVLMGCGTTRWDTKVPAEQDAFLYFDADNTLLKIDGVEKKMGPMAQSFKGKGSYEKPNQILRIPAGKHTITLQKAGYKSEDMPEYDFIAGHHYQLKYEIDPTKTSVGQMLTPAFGSTRDMKESGMEWVIIDVTGQKWAK